MKKNSSSRGRIFSGVVSIETEGLNEKLLAFLFGISLPAVSRIVISWIDSMFLCFGNINIWLNWEEIN